MVKLLDLLKEITIQPYTPKIIAKLYTEILLKLQNNIQFEKLALNVLDSILLEFRYKASSQLFWPYWIDSLSDEDMFAFGKKLNKLKSSIKSKTLNEITIDTSGYYKLHNLTPGDKFISRFKWKGERTLEGKIMSVSMKSDGSAYIQIDISEIGKNIHHTSISIPSPNDQNYMNPPDKDFNKLYGYKFLQGLKIIKSLNEITIDTSQLTFIPDHYEEGRKTYIDYYEHVPRSKVRAYLHGEIESKNNYDDICYLKGTKIPKPGIYTCKIIEYENIPCTAFLWKGFHENIIDLIVINSDKEHFEDAQRKYNIKKQDL